MNAIIATQGILIAALLLSSGISFSCPFAMEWRVTISNMETKESESFKLPKSFVTPSGRTFCKFPSGEYVKGSDGSTISSVLSYCSLDSGDRVFFPAYANSNQIADYSFSIFEKEKKASISFNVHCAKVEI